MAVISNLDYNSNDIRAYENETISNVNVNGTDYHFASAIETIGGVSTDAVDEPIRDLTISGNSAQDGTPAPEMPIDIESVGDKTKNLYDIKSSVNGSILTYDGDNVYTFTKTSSSGRFTSLVDMHIPANTTFTISLNILEYTGSSSYPLGFQFEMADGTYEGTTFTRAQTSRNISFAKDILRVRLFLQLGDEVGTVTRFNNLMIELGDTATEYEPYGYKVPINVNDTTTNVYLSEPLRKVYTWADYIDYANRKVVRQIAQLDLGNRNWSAYKDGNVFYYTTGITPAPITSDSGRSMSNIIQTGNVSGTTTGLGVHVFESGIIRIRPDLTVYDTAEKWKEYLDAHEAYVIYPIANVEEDIEIAEISTTKGINLISAETSTEPSEIKVAYWKQIRPSDIYEDIIQDNGNILIVKTGAEISKSGTNITIGE